MGSAIEWTDDTWNPVVGCSRVSPGCDNCYAERQSATRLRHVPAYAGITDSEGHWTGEVRFLAERLDQPLRWKRPRRIFVNSMSDLFHPEILKLPYLDNFPPLAWIVATMVAAERHTFQILTKRPQVMANVLRHPRFKLDVNACLLSLGHPVMPGGMSEPTTPWPAHLWWGTSIENQRYAFRARHLLDTPAAVRFVSETGGGFNNPLGAIRSAGYVTRGEPIEITETGLEALGSFDPLPSGPDLLAHWLANLPGPAKKILATLVDAGGSCPKEELAERAGYTVSGGGFNNPLGRLRTLGLVDRGEPVQLTEEFAEAIA